MKILFQTPIALPFEKVRDQFNQELFTYITPSLMPFNHLRFDGCKKDDEIHFEFGLMGKKQKWVSFVPFEETNEKGWSFVDEGKVLPWPLSYWRHHHRVDKVSENESMIVDDIEYQCSPSYLTPLVAPAIWAFFAVRPYRYKKYFQEQK